MERLSRIVHTAGRIVRSRLFAVSVLAAATVLMAAIASVITHAVTVTDGANSRVVLTIHSDPYKTVEMAGVEMANYDLLQVDTARSTIAVNRAATVEVVADGTSTLLYMSDGTVEQALQQAGITLNKYDTVDRELTEPVTDGMAVTVDRVDYEDYTVTETIAAETIVKQTPVLDPGRTKVLQSGSNGSMTRTFRKTIVNGEVVETAQIAENITQKAVSRILLRGSSRGTPLSPAPGGIQLDSNNQPVSYKTVYTSKSCTAYSVGTRGASGMRLGVGTVAVNPNVIPYGTKLWITSADGKFVYGYAIAADTGAFASGSRTFCDLYFGTYEECLYFGRRNLNIYVIG